MKVQLVYIILVCACPSSFVHALVAVASLQDLDGEGVLLVAAHVGITHEVEDVFVSAGRGSGEIELHSRLSL